MHSTLSIILTPRLPMCAKFRFCRLSIAELGSEEKSHNQSLNHSLTHSVTRPAYLICREPKLIALEY